MTMQEPGDGYHHDDGDLTPQGNRFPTAEPAEGGFNVERATIGLRLGTYVTAPLHDDDVELIGGSRDFAIVRTAEGTIDTCRWDYLTIPGNGRLEDLHGEAEVRWSMQGQRVNHLAHALDNLERASETIDDFQYKQTVGELKAAIAACCERARQLMVNATEGGDEDE